VTKLIHLVSKNCVKVIQGTVLAMSFTWLIMSRKPLHLRMYGYKSWKRNFCRNIYIQNC